MQSLKLRRIQMHCYMLFIRDRWEEKQSRSCCLENMHRPADCRCPFRETADSFRCTITIRCPIRQCTIVIWNMEFCIHLGKEWDIPTWSMWISVLKKQQDVWIISGIVKNKGNIDDTAVLQCYRKVLSGELVPREAGTGCIFQNKVEKRRSEGI